MDSRVILIVSGATMLFVMISLRICTCRLTASPNANFRSISGEIIISRNVINLAGVNRVEAEELTPVALKGLRDLFAIYAVTGMR